MGKKLGNELFNDKLEIICTFVSFQNVICFCDRVRLALEKISLVSVLFSSPRQPI